MKKTINVNLAGTFFHIDEDAYGKLSRYLEAIKKSLSDPMGSDEIIKDIEARIAELFSEKVESKSQVISIKELDAVISVMGQPEDYMVDEEIFEDVPQKPRRSRSHSSYKQLFRDIDDKFISGVSSGLGHYMGIDAIWVRLLWILLTLASSGLFILFYILLWILVPAAVSTSDKLKMTGEPINISNIEKKFKEGYDAVADKVKNADYDKYGQKVKSGTSGFFETLGSILLTLLKIFVKFFGVLLIIVSLSTIIGLIVSLFTFGSLDIWGNGDLMELFYAVDTTNAPIWLLVLIALFAIGIPFFVLFIIGLKLLFNNLKSIGTPAKIVLFTLWILSIIALAVIGVRQITENAYDGDVIIENPISVRTGDTLKIAMQSDKQYSYEVHKHGGLKLKYNEAKERMIYSNDIRLIVRHTKDSVGKIVIKKKAEGHDFLDAKERAEAIDYNYSFENNQLLLDGFFITDLKNKYRDQEVEVLLYLPVGAILYADENTYSFHRNDSRFNDILDNGDEEQYLRILEDRTECLDCPLEVNDRQDRTNKNSSDWEIEVNRDFKGENDMENEEETSESYIIDADGITTDVTTKDTIN
ncbi:PspC domain-containing protein [Ulvibacter antarcticus]|uniref:Phage shock protein C (PspC) family protein n=1 Tax=Ulvibacter antarcticus TaxID=442714 RepID=A0A3L9YY45_9FLAO|nr:PspC domain-containing protein [Ulvibacter antarcticus]RMA64750.1 phage shock protein C (PspC) family protein [Ulvibacter antarcticus]